MVGELVNTYRGRGNGWSGNRYHFSPGRGIGNRGIGGRSNLDRGINTAPPFLLVSYVQKKGTNRMFSKYNCVIIEFLGPGLS